MNSHERELMKIIVSLEAAWAGMMRLGKIIEANGMFATRNHYEDELAAYRRQAAIEDQEMLADDPVTPFLADEPESPDPAPSLPGAINAPPGG